jgi:hypothetical protein
MLAVPDVKLVALWLIAAPAKQEIRRDRRLEGGKGSN